MALCPDCGRPLRTAGRWVARHQPPTDKTARVTSPPRSWIKARASGVSSIFIMFSGSIIGSGTWYMPADDAVNREQPIPRRVLRIRPPAGRIKSMEVVALRCQPRVSTPTKWVSRTWPTYFKRFAMAVNPSRSAMSRAVRPDALASVLSAPLSNSSLTMASWPSVADRMRAVRPSLS